MAMPEFTEAQLAILHVLLNSISTGVNGEFTDFEEALHAAASVETVGDLPTSGNWLGRVILVEESETPYHLTAMPSTWTSAYRLDAAEVTPAYASGWMLPSVNRLTRASGYATLEFNAFRTAELAPGGVLVDIPPGFRTDWHVWSQAWGLAGAWSNNQIYYDIVTHQIKSKNGAHDGDSLAVYMHWQLNGE